MKERKKEFNRITARPPLPRRLCATARGRRASGADEKRSLLQVRVVNAVPGPRAQAHTTNLLGWRSPRRSLVAG